MLTVADATSVSESESLSHNETSLGDVEIYRRVIEIRSKWSLSERVRRRREAESRFVDLLNSLNVEQEAA